MKKTHLKKATRPATEADIAEVKADIANLTGELRQMETRMTRGFTALIKELSTNMDDRFKKVHEDIDLVHTHLNRIERKFNPLVGETMRDPRQFKTARAVRRT